MKKIWHIKTTAVPVRVGALDMIKKRGIDKRIYKISGSPKQYEIQNITLCGSAHFRKRVLSIWLKNIT